MAHGENILERCELGAILRNQEIDVRENNETLRASRTKCIADVLEEVVVLIDVHFFNEFSETKTKRFLKRVLENLNVIIVRNLRRAWRTLNCSPLLKLIGETQEDLCVGKRKELITKKKQRRSAGAAEVGFL